MTTSEKRHQRIKRRAYSLWEAGGRPAGHALDFWLMAESEDNICVLGFDSCPYQEQKPTTGGRHVSLCRRKNGNCPYRAGNVNKTKVRA